MRKGAAEEQVKPQVKQKDKLDQLLDMVGLKQEQILIKYAFYPFWKTVVATAIFLTVILLANGSWIPSTVLIVIICFGFYECSKLRARLKILDSLF